MRLLLLAIAALAAVACAGYAELVLDIRAPRSRLEGYAALGAGASLSLVGYNKLVADTRASYGSRGSVTLTPSTGEVTVEVDGRVIERGRVERQFRAIYGLFAVGARERAASIFPFDIEPGAVPARYRHEPNIERLRDRLGERVPAKYLDFRDADWTRGACATPSVAELVPRKLADLKLADLLHLRAATVCMVRWTGGTEHTMLVLVLLAPADPWLRPFARWICRLATAAAVNRSATASDGRPDYAGCVLVDHPRHTGPTGTQGAFTSVMFEVQPAGLARID